jgi:hypothetical protein
MTPFFTYFPARLTELIFFLYFALTHLFIRLVKQNRRRAANMTDERAFFPCCVRPTN